VIDLPAINMRYGHKEFLAGAADESFFQHLINEINGLARPDETLELPSFQEAGAWTKGYALWQALKQRQQRVVAKVKAEEDSEEQRQARASAREWQSYCNSREALLDYGRRHVALWSYLFEHLGLEPDDLREPIPPEDHVDAVFGKYSDWRAVAGRIYSASVKLANMKSEDLDAVPERVAAQRRDRAIERRLTALEQQYLALESRLPSVQELILQDAEKNYGESHYG
jgi:hypothetical protein